MTRRWRFLPVGVEARAGDDELESVIAGRDAGAGGVVEAPPRRHDAHCNGGGTRSSSMRRLHARQRIKGDK